MDLNPGYRDKFMRSLFRISQKDKNLKRLVRGYWQGVPVSVEGIRFSLYPTDNSTERNIYLNRMLEEKDSLHTLQNHLAGKHCLIYDIGANCGLYSIFLARVIGSQSVVHAFEPSPVMADRLRHNLELNSVQSMVKVHKVALSSEHGTAYLNVHNRNHGQSSLRSLEQSEHSIEVPQIPLADHHDSRNGFEKFVIKIDVEGREDDVLFPFISLCEDEQLPDLILLEMVLENTWNSDLRSLLMSKGYQIAFEGDGNVLFQR